MEQTELPLSMPLICNPPDSAHLPAILHKPRRGYINAAEVVSVNYQLVGESGFAAPLGTHPLQRAR
jgi:hypothetical protein